MNGGGGPGGGLATVRWWLRLQLGLALVGGVTWFVGAVLKLDFVAGVGAGMLISALVLRLGRRAAHSG